MKNTIDKLGCAYNKNYKMKDKEEEEIRMPENLFELYLAVEKRLTKWMEMRQAEHIKLKMLEAINQAITNFEQKETLGKHTSLTGKEKRVRNSPGCSPTFAEEPSADPPFLKERDRIVTIPGYKFQPTDKEAILNLQKKHSNPCQTPSWSPIKDCPGFYGTQPRHLPDANGIKEKKALYYYVRTKKKMENGDRTSHHGYWKANGHTKILSETGSEIGYRRTLNYCEYPDKNRKSSKLGKSTNWTMHEYRLATTTGSQSHEESLEHWTICKVTWTGKNFEVTDDFSREGSIGPSENKRKNELTMHTQNEGDLKISKFVDSEQEEIAQTNYHSIGDEFGRWTQEKRDELREQRMNREIHQSEEISPPHAFETHPTPKIMATTQEVETAVEPPQLENPGGITGEFDSSSFPTQTYASIWDSLYKSKSTGTEGGIQSRNTSCPEENSSTLDPSGTSYFSDHYLDFTEGNMEFSDGTLPGQNPTSQLPGDHFRCSDSTWHLLNSSMLTGTEDGIQSPNPSCPEENPSTLDLLRTLDFSDHYMEFSDGTLPGQNPTSQLPGDRFRCSDSTWHLLNSSILIGTEDGIQSPNPSCPEENPSTLDLLPRLH